LAKCITSVDISPHYARKFTIAAVNLAVNLKCRSLQPIELFTLTEEEEEKKK